MNAGLPGPGRVAAGRLRLVVFDLDGTLLDSMGHVRDAFLHAVAPWVAWEDGRAFRAALGGPHRQCLANLLGPRVAEDLEAAEARLLAWSRERMPEVGLFPGARDLLGALDAAGVGRALWTSRDRASTMWHLGRCGLDGWRPGAVACGDDGEPPKPDPATLRRFLRESGVAPEEALMVGDAAADGRGARAAGVPAVLIGEPGIDFPEEEARAAAAVCATAAGAYAWVVAAVAAAGRGGG